MPTLSKITLLLLSLNLSFYSNAEDKLIDHYKIYSACIDEQAPINNSVVHGCAEYASDSAKKEITLLYRKIYKYISASSIDDALKFEKAQQAWISYRNNHCELYGSYVGSPMYSYCPMMLNISRAIELRELANLQ
ncbi:lysozyme inhibitor LprI family protein [Pseudomonas sp. GCM10022188]|uniref:lysozyme inhibitor LprI family protein n=1 Tax=Pseudomonas TaxID=286 RepID=UPI001E451D7A|nr:lysozyme inhibitor LprI family protein [Pseudomonas oryzagri]MCC6075751.1 lysozyme inhibitor LprI family protein [Pseudomonas oryzagri]